MSAREEILGRVRAALADVEPTEVEHAPVVAPPGAAGGSAEEVLDLFAERVEDYRAVVVRCTPEGLAAAVADAVPAGSRVVVPDALPREVVAGIDGDLVPDDGLSAAELDAVDAVVTACRVGIAETGTIVLDHQPDQGRRAVTLVPDRHVCVVRADQVVADVPDAVAVLDPSRPLTWISGPSATSDIELSRVEGVHGPRHLTVIVVGGPGER
ncbi:lactate utilization protein C [Nocardioides sp. GY 10113]|uniref:LutC/YkgG family protein n=1 Tax=Nocardioides sp. GY 10113 TaxID=2569761 RepID=UPI0010A763DD|nr:lactate utilization protein C [Nocardioides sp. GY 10113]TIC85024.1 lactate utilization protein C [Nocardioides sp. GY 10113]